MRSAGNTTGIECGTDFGPVSRIRPVKLALAALFMCAVLICAACSKTNRTDNKAEYDKEKDFILPTLTSAVKDGEPEGRADETGADDAGTDDNSFADRDDANVQEAESGFENGAENYGEDEALAAGKVLLRINEVLPTNKKYCEHNGGYYDMIEIYNASDEPVKLSDYCLSDSKKHLADYPLPEEELLPGGYAVFYCTGRYHAKDAHDLGFKLSYFGEKLFLSDREGNIIDTFQYPRLPQNMSAGREGEEIRIYDTPGLGTENTGGYERMSVLPAVDLEPGFYEGVQTVSFTTAGIIRYTLDGSTPDLGSKIWDGTPIVISETCALRAYSYEAGCHESFTATYNYLIGEPEYELDVLMLSVRDSDFDKLNENYDSNRKYAANISLFSEGKLEFSSDCGISLFGGTSRAYAKKSYQIAFNTAYGPSKLRYRLFDGLDIDEFDALVLRSGSQDNDGALMRDEFVSGVSTSKGIIDDVLVQAYRPVDLYVNDEYWGIYYIREHIDEEMVASHYGCEPEEVTIIKQMKTVRCGRDAKEWLDLWEYVKNNKLKSDEAYAYIKSVADVQSIADYYIIQLWCGNIDMDNVYVCKAGGRWFYILYDLDLSLCRDVEGTTARQLGKYNSGFYTFNALIYRLLENREFRELFCRRMSEIVGEVYSDENVLSYASGLAGKIYHDMEYNCLRWHPVKDPTGKLNYSSFKSWKRNLESLRKRITGRGRLIIEDFIRNKEIEQDLIDKYFSEMIG